MYMYFYRHNVFFGGKCANNADHAASDLDLHLMLTLKNVQLIKFKIQSNFSQNSTVFSNHLS